MIEWAKIKEETASLFVDLLGLPRAQVRWQDEPEGSAWANDPTIFLRIKTLGEIGIDEERRTVPTDDLGNLLPDDMEVNVCGNRRFTLSVRCESMSQDISDPKFAGNVVSNLKTRIGRSTSIERLHHLFAFADWSPTNFFDYRDSEGRQIATYVIDFFCTTVDNDVDTTRDAGGWIGEVEILGAVTDGAAERAIDLDVNAK